MTDNLPTNWEEELEKSAKAVANVERATLSQISLRAGVMMYQGIPVPNNKLECVIVAAGFQNRYYKGKFDPKNISSPACYSLSLDGQNMVPAPEAPEPQAESCERCPNFAWGSDPGGGRGKACKAGRRLVLLPAKSVIEGGARKAEMALLTIPVTSTKNWAAYVNGCAAEYRRPPWGLLTSVSVTPDPKSQFQVRFETLGIVENSYLGDVHSRMDQAHSVLLAPYEASAEEAPVKDSKKF